MLTTTKKKTLSMLIVDDEMLMREGLKTFFEWEKYGITEVLATENGSQAIDISKKYNPDIIISDIRMPGIDGLAMIEKLKRLLPYSVFIIISGYDDFEYTKKAISLGVTYYMLKPVNSAELQKAIIKSIKSLEDIYYKKEMEDRLARQLKQSIPILRNNYISNLFSGIVNRNTKNIIPEIKELGLDLENKFYTVLVIKACNTIKSSFNEENKINLLVMETTGKLLKNYSDTETIKSFGLCDPGIVKMIISCSDKEKLVSILKKVFLELIEDIFKFFGIKLIGGVGPFSTDIGDICEISKKALKITEYKSIMAENGIVFFDDINEIDTNRPFLILPKQSKRLFDCIECNNIQEIGILIDDIKTELKDLEYFPKEYLYSSILEILVSQIGYLYDRGVCIENVFKTDFLSFEYLNKFENIDSLFLWLKNTLIEFARIFNEFKMAITNDVVSDIKTYIEHNISSDISVNKLSKIFHYNPCYLSRLFKNKVGINFTDYVNSLRIDTAKKLLICSDMEISDVCEKIGYKDSKYFVSIFKKATGMTPLQFRKGNTDYV